MAQEIYQLDPLFNDVQMNRVFEDGKTFVDCIPKKPLDSIQQEYLDQKEEPAFSLNKFVADNFDQPKLFGGHYQSNTNKTTAEHINELWEVLTRQPDEKSGSLLPLPYPYIVPGGRFGEVYYWDSYFTMLGLLAAGRHEMIGNMVANFSHLIQTVGFIPNGNRSYYLGRSQPPFYALMVQLLATIKGKNILVDLLPTLEKEYDFWMKGQGELTNENSAISHVVKMKDAEILNRYWDEYDTARPESYREDVELTHSTKQPANSLYRHLRAGAESGWDYSHRWFKDEKNFASISAASIVPVDLNCLLYYAEHTIAEAHHIKADEAGARKYELLAEARKQAIQKYCWSNEAGFFVDYDWEDDQQKNIPTLAGMAPLFFKLATQEQADLVAESINGKFLQPGGVVTTLEQTGQQWDAPNGWAPLQWMTIKGLSNYDHTSLAKEISDRWLALNDKVYKATGKMMEKYNVMDLSQLAGGGEYQSQDGFGWTNGVYLALKDLF